VGWALAGLLGALAGLLVSPTTFLYPNSMDAIFVYGFTAAVIGGLDSPAGAVAGGPSSVSGSATSAGTSAAAEARTWSRWPRSACWSSC